ncbi:hypothetical protein HPB49_019753 [Dermacentor silvarum]|uniref:Uncharacterized protein n=1 Tax=Dermacentor silvarum TaxID=543639 RepID=A0ACB8E2P0_DERSI|nr:hypothetical protein HPB49_019753 [Dermacentor silvarum]
MTDDVLESAALLLRTRVSRDDISHDTPRHRELRAVASAPDNVPFSLGEIEHAMALGRTGDEDEPAAQEDTSYVPSFSESFFRYLEARQTAFRWHVLQRAKKFIVFESCLRELLTTCKVCGQAVGDISSKVVGTLLIVEGMCDKEHMLQWRSQPLVRGSGAGNILLAAGVLFSGCAVAATLRCLNSIGVQTITERTFYNYQRAYLLPAINELFHRKQAEMASELAGLQVDLAGDGRCDSPGLQCQSPEVPNSVSMEKQGLAKCLMGVEKLGIRIRSLTTDRHPGVNRYCRVEKPEIKHWFDTWHVAKGYVDDFMQDVVERCEHSSYKEGFLSCEKSPPCHMSLGFERPSKQELIAQRRTRFPMALTLSNSS